MQGGTGSRSEFEEQPDFMPDKYECGTPNTIGLAGLAAGAAFTLEQGVEGVREKEEALTRRFLNHLQEFSGDVTVYGPPASQKRIPLISFNLRNITPSDAALYFDEQWGVMCRPGLHCAPAAHRTIGTFPQGTVRFSFGFFNTEEHADLAAKALRQLIKG
jgi:selenocysteine lyase/cysteine desulfurase